MQTRERLRVELAELELSAADHIVDEAAARDERARLQRELAGCLRALDHQETRRGRRAARLGFLPFLSLGGVMLVIAGGLYLLNHEFPLPRFSVCSNSVCRRKR